MLKQAPRISVENVAGLCFKKCTFQIIFGVFMFMFKLSVQFDCLTNLMYNNFL